MTRCSLSLYLVIKILFVGDLLVFLKIDVTQWCKHPLICICTDINPCWWATVSWHQSSHCQNCVECIDQIIYQCDIYCGPLMMRWVVGSILHGVDPLSYFSFQPVLHDWCNKDCGMCYPVCGMVHIKEPLLLIGKSSLCGGSGFPLSLSEWSSHE